MATTTPLVANMFDTLFSGQIDDKANAKDRKRRCGVCEVSVEKSVDVVGLV